MKESQWREPIDGEAIRYLGVLERSFIIMRDLGHCGTKPKLLLSGYLADALHNLPEYLLSSEFNPRTFWIDVGRLEKWIATGEASKNGVLIPDSMLPLWMAAVGLEATLHQSVALTSILSKRSYVGYQWLVAWPDSRTYMELFRDVLLTVRNHGLSLDTDAAPYWSRLVDAIHDLPTQLLAGIPLRETNFEPRLARWRSEVPLGFHDDWDHFARYTARSTPPT